MQTVECALLASVFTLAGIASWGTLATALSKSLDGVACTGIPATVSCRPSGISSKPPGIEEGLTPRMFPFPCDPSVMPPREARRPRRSDRPRRRSREPRIGYGLVQHPEDTVAGATVPHPAAGDRHHPGPAVSPASEPLEGLERQGGARRIDTAPELRQVLRAPSCATCR